MLRDRFRSVGISVGVGVRAIVRLSSIGIAQIHGGGHTEIEDVSTHSEYVSIGAFDI